MHRTILVGALVAAVFAPALHAADYGAPPSPAPAEAPADPLDVARGFVAQKRWREAIDELRRVNKPASADWNNLMGYAQRKQATPDLAAAQQYYDAALRIDPKHRGALEYSGELMLMKKDLAAAKSRLVSLEAACGRGCPEVDQLKTAIASYESGKTQ